jgi:hypothetical protein
LKAQHAQNRGALRHLDLHGLVTKVQERNSRLSGDAQHAAAHVQFAPGILIGPELISGGKGTVGTRFDPVRGARRLKGDAAFDHIQAGDAAGRVGVLSAGEARQSENQEKR